MCGICPERQFLDIEARYRRYPHWRDRGWIPVAGDGCGNHYVLDTTVTTRTGHPILFLDHERSVEQVCDTADHVTASGLWPFLRYNFLDEIHAAYDLFDEQEALSQDPGLADDVGVPRPWEE
jgi:hypothetical protein